MVKNKTNRKQFVDKNPIESVRDIGNDVAKSFKDLTKGMTSDLFKQFLGLDHSQEGNQRTQKGDLAEGEELVLKELQKEEVEKPEIEAGELAIEYKREIMQAGSYHETNETQSITAKLKEILAELKQLVTASKELQIEYKEAVAEQRITKPGKYHESFFEWMLATVRSARIRVEDSAAWLNAFKSKKAKRDYWFMADEKRGGTSFSLSNERNVATQVG